MTENERTVCDLYALVVTTCCRSDLPAKMPRSFYAHANMAPAQLVVVEDSADETVMDVVGSLGYRRHLDQVQAIDHTVRCQLATHAALC